MSAFESTIAKPNEPRVSAMADTIVRHVLTLEHGTLLTYADLRRLIFENPQKQRGRAAILQARKRLLRDAHKLLVNIRDKGYQIARPNEHVGESRRVDGYARRRVRWALAITANAEMEKLTPQERQQVEEQVNRLRLKLAIDKNMAKARISTSEPGEIVIPTGRRLAALLQEKPPEDKAS